jgi:hypothetical protein
VIFPIVDVDDSAFHFEDGERVLLLSQDGRELLFGWIRAILEKGEILFEGYLVFGQGLILLQL